MTIPDPALFNFTYVGDTTITNSPFQPDFDLSYLLPKSFLADDFWSDLLLTTATVLDEQVHTPLSNIAYLRVPEAQGRIYKALHAGMMGYDIKDSLIDDAGAGYDRLNNNVGGYLYEQGKDNFICFLGYVLGIKIALVCLWTKDYVNFFPSTGGAATVFEGGDWYPTTHVGIVYDTNDAVSPTLPVTEQDLTDLFYKHAPIDLVLKWLATNTTINMGTLYVQVMTTSSCSVQCYIDARGDLNVNMAVQALSLYSLNTRNNVYCPNSSNVLQLSYNSTCHLEDTIPVSSGIVSWKAASGANIPQNISVRRPSQNGWCFTGVGTGDWITANLPRYNVDPVTGSYLGILVEPTTQNYVRSSTKIGQVPWVVTGSPFTAVQPAKSLDGGPLTVWQAQTPNDCISEIVFLPAGTYTAQIVYIAYELGILYANPAGFVPRIDAYSVTPITSQTNGTSLAMYQTLGTFTFTSQGYLGNWWNLLTSTFTITEDANITITLPLTGALGLFYVGIEAGNIPTSFIYTDDCRIGVREEDIVYIDTSMNAKGAVYFNINSVSFANKTSFPSNVENINAVMFDITGDQRVEIKGISSTSVSLIITDYPNKTPIVTTYSPLSVVPNCLFIEWDGVNTGDVGINNSVYTYPYPMSVARTCVGSGWYGHIDYLFVSPVSTNTSLVQQIIATNT